MYVTTPVTISTAFAIRTSPAMTFPPLVRFAKIVADPPLTRVLHRSALARPVSPLARHAGGACANSCCSVRRFAGRSISRLRGITTLSPRTTIRPPDQTSAGLSREIRSISPDDRRHHGSALRRIDPQKEQSTRSPPRRPPYHPPFPSRFSFIPSFLVSFALPMLPAVRFRPLPPGVIGACMAPTATSRSAAPPSRPRSTWTLYLPAEARGVPGPGVARL